MYAPPNAAAVQGLSRAPQQRGADGQAAGYNVMMPLGGVPGRPMMTPHGEMQMPIGMSPVGMGMDNAPSMLSYTPENIVLVAGQYREVRPTMVPALQGARFHFETLLPARRLPDGMQLDQATGTIWGTPSSDHLGPDFPQAYQRFTIVANGPLGTASAEVGIKVIDFQPNTARITHVSQLAKNKYIVMVDTRNQ